MRSKTVLALVAGSILVHAAVAACTSGTGAHALADPIATPGGVEVSAEACTKTYSQESPVPRPGDAGTSARSVPFAEHAYPGKSKFEIAAHVTHWTTIDDPTAVLRPPDYAGGLNLQSAVYARDGFAGAGCKEGTTSYFVWKP